MIEFEFNPEDVRRIQKGFEKVNTELSSGELLLNAALAIERQAKINATGRPGPMVRTGRLRASINTQVSPDKTEALVGTNVIYAPFVELGHRQQIGRYVHAIRRRLVNAYAPPYPFLKPALEQVKASGEMDNIMTTYGTKIETEWLS